jgi:hypothetical protein
MPLMLPPSFDSADGALQPMPSDFGASDEDPSPLRFLRNPVKYDDAGPGPPGAGIAPPAIASPTDALEAGPAASEDTAGEWDPVPDPGPELEAPSAPADADVSPILNAIDTAERIAQAPDTHPQGIPMSVTIRVPHAPPDDVAVPEPPAMPVAVAPLAGADGHGDGDDERSDASVREASLGQRLRFGPSIASQPPPPLPPAEEDLDLPYLQDAPPVELLAEASAPEDVPHQDLALPELPARPIAAAASPERRPIAPAETRQAPDPVREAAARIAAEATATAEALESLKRLIEDKLPVTPPRQAQHPPLAPERPRPMPPPSAPGHPTRMTAGLPPYIAPAQATPPLPVPLLEPGIGGSGGRIYLLGFLAGFGLALVAGAMLYLFISIG